MDFKDLLIILIICGIIYYLYTLNKAIPSILTKKENGIKQPETTKIENNNENKNEIDIVTPTPYINPFINPYYDPYYYPYWDPYDLYPYGIIGVDAGADWNSTYNVVTRDYHKRRNIKDRKDRKYRRNIKDRIDRRNLRDTRYTRDRRNRR